MTTPHLDNAEIVGCTRSWFGDPSNYPHLKMGLEQQCKEWGIQTYASFEEIVSDPTIDALIINSVNSLHYDQIMQALEHDKHVLVEKPVVLDVAQLDAIKAKAQQQNKIVFPGHNFVYRGAVQQAKQIIDSGQLGRLVYGSFISSFRLGSDHEAGWRRKKALSGGGTLMDSGHHLVYMALYLLGRPCKIHSFCSQLMLEIESEDLAQVSLLYPDNSLGYIMQSWVGSGGTTDGVRIFGSKGYLCITDALYLNDERLNSDVDYANSFSNQARVFMNCIARNSQPLSTLDDVRLTLQIIQGAYRSNDQDRSSFVGEIA